MADLEPAEISAVRAQTQQELRWQTWVPRDFPRSRRRPRTHYDGRPRSRRNVLGPASLDLGQCRGPLLFGPGPHSGPRTLSRSAHVFPRSGPRGQTWVQYVWPRSLCLRSLEIMLNIYLGQILQHQVSHLSRHRPYDPQDRSSTWTGVCEQVHSVRVPYFLSSLS